ncbi:MAG: Stk1 family PASTA domain-containing Ser/Thr kinase [Ruminococcaceae bacterium]|nr:Stk1 family PASTA domain-containing Ser/Thr kinase [Oscillospiraceae bacterium]
MDENANKYLGMRLDNRYEIQQVIGKGGMAYVFKARCHLLNRNVAIKMLREDMAHDESFRENFKREAQAVAMLSHPNIVSIYDVSRNPELDYIIMELIEGVTLKIYMKTKGILSCKESVHFLNQIAKALSHAHAKGIVHRDIKPQNIMIGMDGAVKVADFGIAHLENANAPDNSAVGSVHYISPEQAKGQNVDARSDIYSLGVMMYEMLTGKLPYTGETAEAVALQHVSSVPRSLREINSDIPEELEAITLKAMNADINLRYQTIDEFINDLNEYRLANTSSLPIINANKEDTPSEEAAPQHPIPQNVRPLRRSGEMSKESFARRRRRANTVSTLLGIGIVLIVAVALFVWLWDYWLGGLFAEPERVDIPDFVGRQYEEVINTREYRNLFVFVPTYDVNSEANEGEIISQHPDPHKSIMRDEDGIEIELVVSAGIQLLKVPDVANKEYHEAVLEIQKMGFVPECVYELSADITEDYVISTSPEAGDTLPMGSKIYITISIGPDVKTLQMPNLVGLSRHTAVSKVESSRLTLGTITYVDDDMPAGTVIWQSIPAYTTVNEHDKVYLQVSNGPKEVTEEETESEDDGG